MDKGIQLIITADIRNYQRILFVQSHNNCLSLPFESAQDVGSVIKYTLSLESVMELRDFLTTHAAIPATPSAAPPSETY